MFRDTIEGLDKVIRTPVPKGLVLLVTGGPGTLKSSTVYTILSNYLRKTHEFGLYVTLEESKASHLRNMRSLGMEIYEGLKMFDYQDIRREYGMDSEEGLDILTGIEDLVKFYKKKETQFTCVAIDSLNAVYSLIPLANLRRRIYHFFDTFKVYDLTSFIIAETPKDLSHEIYGGEGFLADGIINMGTMRLEEDITIYMQIEKLRGVAHSRKKYQVGVGPNGLAILGPEYE